MMIEVGAGLEANTYIGKFKTNISIFKEQISVEKHIQIHNNLAIKNIKYD